MSFIKRYTTNFVNIQLHAEIQSDYQNNLLKCTITWATVCSPSGTSSVLRAARATIDVGSASRITLEVNYKKDYNSL